MKSKNQSCSITVLINMIEDKKLEFDKDIVLKFDIFEGDKEVKRKKKRQNKKGKPCKLAMCLLALSVRPPVAVQQVPWRSLKLSTPN